MKYGIKSGISTQDADNETIILDKDKQKIHQLNPVASLIWKSISKQIQNIPELICENFHVDIETARKDYQQLTSELLNEGLIFKEDD